MNWLFTVLLWALDILEWVVAPAMAIYEEIAAERHSRKLDREAKKRSQRNV